MRLGERWRTRPAKRQSVPCDPDRYGLPSCPWPRKPGRCDRTLAARDFRGSRQPSSLTASELNRSPRSAGLGHLNVEVLLRLVAELNDHTRFHARRMRLHGDVTGADSVLCWQTGYPFSVNLSRGYPRYNPGEFSANDLLTRGEPDLCVIIGSETLSQFTPPALDHLRRIPTIVLDYPAATPIILPSVRITTAPYGLHAPGTAYRMDEVPIPFKASLHSRWPTDEVVLEGIAVRLKT